MSSNYILVDPSAEQNDDDTQDVTTEDLWDSCGWDEQGWGAEDDQ